MQRIAGCRAPGPDTEPPSFVVRAGLDQRRYRRPSMAPRKRGTAERRGDGSRRRGVIKLSGKSFYRSGRTPPESGMVPESLKPSSLQP
jgi:hypothetical protein